MRLSYTPQMEVSKQQKYTKPNNCVWKLTPTVPEAVTSNTQQCETVKRFCVCPLQRGPSVAKDSNSRKCVALCFLCYCKGSWCSEPLQRGSQGRTAVTDIRQYLYAPVAPTCWITSEPFSCSFDLATGVVWIVLQGNGNYAGDQSQNLKSQSGWNSNSSACLSFFMLWAPSLQPGICAVDLNPRRLEYLRHGSVERLKAPAVEPPFSIYTYGRVWLGMWLFWHTNAGQSLGQATLTHLVSVVSFLQSLEKATFPYSKNRNRHRKALPSVWQERGSCLWCKVVL